MGKSILYTIIRKLIVFVFTAIIGLLCGFTASFIFGRSVLMIGISATVMIVIAITLLMTITSLIGDGVLIKAGKWKRWFNLVLIIVPTLFLVYYYFLNGGIFLELPEFNTLSKIVLYGSIVLSLLYWRLENGQQSKWKNDLKI
jgi:hypothetical protein